ncbi:MAG: hypothetical protein ABI611_04930 [Solirubrobacteraceae bacterium]
MHKFLSGLLAGVALLVAAPAAFADDVLVRVEGANDTLVPRTGTPIQPGGTFTKDGNAAHRCASSSAAGALESVTGGDWSGRWASFGDYEIQAIKGERYASNAGDPSGRYWAFWLNYRYATAGACGSRMQAGDEVLFFPDCFGQGCDRNPTPLRITSVPGSAQPGQAFDVRVAQYGVTFDADFTATTTEAPAGGATVSAADRSFTTGADGVAHVTVNDRSLAGVRATKPGYVRSATENVCVDCGPTYTPPVRDASAPGATVASVRSGAVYSRRRAPRLLRGSVTADPSGLHSVKLKLTRRVGKRCAYLSGRRERFVKMRCGHGSFLRIGDRADWSYLLPARLRRGSYVLEVKAIDGAFNRGTPARVRFRVK